MSSLLSALLLLFFFSGQNKHLQILFLTILAHEVVHLPATEPEHEHVTKEFPPVSPEIFSQDQKPFVRKTSTY